jgi:hypothetical protein
LLPKQKLGDTEKINCVDQFLQARPPQILTPKEQCFDMPISANYGSTGRPPGEYHLQYHLRHSSKKLTNIVEFSQPPFDIFFIKTTNNNNNNCIICYYNNGGIICNEGILMDSEADAGAGAADVDAHINVALMNQIFC